MAPSRGQLAQVYRPVGPKRIGTYAWAPAGIQNIVQSVDLSLPIRGIRLVFKGRVAVAGANFASMNPEGILNLITGILIQGVNSRTGGNAILYNLDLATLYSLQHLFQNAAAYYIDNGNTVAGITPVPTYPFPALFSGTIANHDFIIAVDLPFHPFDAPPGVRPQFIVRQDEWKDTITITLTYGSQGNGAVQGALGTGAAGTTVTFTAFGSGAGSPTIDLYTLPIVMGDLQDGVIPGFVTRTQQPVSVILQTAGNPITLAILQKVNTSRVYLKSGVSTVNPYFDSLNDTNVTQLGITLGQNRNVRNILDVFSHKLDQVNQYRRPPIQGYNVMDFLQSGNPDASYPGDRVGEGTTFELDAAVAGLASAYGIIVQEKIMLRAEGSLYSF